MTITKQEIQIQGILEGLSNPDILARVLAVYPDAETSKECVAWYRSHLKRGALPKDHPKHDKRFAKYVTEGQVLPARGEAPRVGKWVFVEAPDMSQVELDLDQTL